MARPHMTDRRFRRLFRMPKEAFDDLVGILDNYREANCQTSKYGRPVGRPQRLSTQLQLAMTLRYLAGGQVIDISEMYNVWDSTLYKVIHRTVTRLYHALPDWPLVTALNADCDAPLMALSDGFRRRSHHHMSGAIGAIDGLLVPIRAPHDSVKAKAYHCRKGFSCVNVQGICDANYRLIYCSIARTPGAVHDSFAWQRDPMHTRIHSPDSPTASMLKRRGYYLIGDDAYACNHTMAVPWPGKWDTDSPQLCYNYHHSSARIAVEQTFGMLVRKWLLLKRPFEGSLKRTTRSAGIYLTVGACCKLVCAHATRAHAVRTRTLMHTTNSPRRVAAQLLHRGRRHERRRPPRRPARRPRP